MKKLVSTRQIIVILLISILTLKVLYLPSLLANDIGRDSYIYVFIMLILNFLSLAIFLIIFNKNPDLSFYELLQKMFGTIFAKIILFFVMLFFLLRCFGLFQSNFSYLSENLYSSIKWYNFTITIVFGVVFIISFGLNSIARLIEVFAPITILGFVISLIISVAKADFSNLLPVLENGFLQNIPTIFNFTFWFSDYIIFAIFFGKIKTTKHFNFKICIITLIAIFLVTLFVASSYSLFNYNSVTHTNSISDVLQVLPSTSDMGSFDWLLILIWDIALFLNLLLSFSGAYYCFRHVFFNKHPVFIIFILLFSFLIPSIIVNFDINTGINFVKNFTNYFCLAIELLLPILMLIFSFKLKGGKNKNV